MKENDKSVFRDITLARLEKNMDTLNGIMNKLNKAVENIQPLDGMSSEEMLLQSPNAVRNITTLMKEVRSTHESVANLMGVMTAHANAGPPNVAVVIPNINRGDGIGNMKVVNE